MDKLFHVLYNNQSTKLCWLFRYIWVVILGTATIMACCAQILLDHDSIYTSLSYIPALVFNQRNYKYHFLVLSLNYHQSLHGNVWNIPYSYHAGSCSVYWGRERWKLICSHAEYVGAVHILEWEGRRGSLNTWKNNRDRKK